MNEHEHFEYLCALVAGNLASAEQVSELHDHLQGCEECRSRFGDFAHIGAAILSAKSIQESRVPAEMTARFVARANAEGIPLHKPIYVLPTWASRHSLMWTGAVAAIAVLVIIAMGSLPKIAIFGHRQSDQAAGALPESVIPAHDGVVADAREASSNAANELQAALTSAATEKQRLIQVVDDLNNQIKTKAAHEEDLNSRIAALQHQLDQLKQQEAAKDMQSDALNDQLKKRESVNADQLASLTESQIQNRDLRDQLAERDTLIREQQQLLAASSQARDLIIARNLHIIDVHDNNGDGKRQRAFGRIFYTEGKQIVFYAYDLDSAAKLKKQVAFYVWGGKLGNERAVQNLGIFRNEDPGAGRWVLTFDDPHVLAEINTVFVTAESTKMVKRPDGKPILYAFLGVKPNHP